MHKEFEPLVVDATDGAAWHAGGELFSLVLLATERQGQTLADLEALIRLEERCWQAQQALSQIDEAALALATHRIEAAARWQQRYGGSPEFAAIARLCCEQSLQRLQEVVVWAHAQILAYLTGESEA